MIGDANGGLFRLMFERSADAILLLDTGTNSFVEYNQATLTMLACSPAELSAMHPSMLSPDLQPDGRPSFEKANEMIATAVARGSHRFEWVHRSPHRSDFWVEVLLTPIQSGAAPLLLVVWRDITGRRQAEAALREAQRRESIGVLAAGIAHDFNNLLSAVGAHVDLARLSLPPAHPAGEHLDAIDVAVRRATDLSRQMLAYGGRAETRVEAVDLSRVVTELADLLAVSVPKSVRIVRRLVSGLPSVRADVAQVQQVVLNLVTNAGEAIGEANGEVTLTTSVQNLDADALTEGFPGQPLAPGRYVVLEVADTGPGIPADVLGRIFDPFFSTKRAGRGLGLSAVLGTLRAHSGGYRISFSHGQGTRFAVCFPASGLASEPEREAMPTSWQGLRGSVLLVDDEDLVRSATRAMLEGLGATVLEARDGAEALEVFRAEAARIDWVLMDLTMPRLDGHSAFLQMKEVRPDVKVVLVSGWAASDLVARYAHAPPAAYLEKPFRLQDLLAVASRVGAAVA